MGSEEFREKLKLPPLEEGGGVKRLDWPVARVDIDVPREMLDNVVYAFEHGNVVVLRANALLQTLGRQLLQHGDGFVHGLMQAVAQLGNRHAASGGKLRVANPRIGRVANAGDNPLPHVAAKMQDQISDGIRIRSLSRPDAILAQFAKPLLNARRVLARCPA